MPRTGVLQRVRSLPSRLGFHRDWSLILLAVIVGLAAGLVAVAFELMVESSGRLFFGSLRQGIIGRFPVLQAFVLVILPAIGGLAVGAVQHYLSRQPAGHGIPEVIEALTLRQGVLPGRTGVFKAITASFTIGSGGSAGVEGPIVQIGSVLGSKVGQWLKLDREQMQAMVGCGAAAGLASIFNAPIAGVIFVMEVLLRDFSLKTLMPIVVASVFGVAVAQSVHGRNEAMFSLPAAVQPIFQFADLGWFALLGVLCGMVGYAFTRLFYLVERLWHRSGIHPALRPALGGAMLGAMASVFVYFFPQPVHDYAPPAFFSNGYSVIEALFHPMSYASEQTMGPGLARATLAFLLAALLCKIVGTALTLGSGGSGGIFAPSLFMGATLGGAVGLLVQTLTGSTAVSPAGFALAGMAGVLAAAVRCPLAAFLLVFELTRDYKAILPVMLVAILATIVAQALLRESIYTLALRERGVKLSNLRDATVLRRVEVAKVPLLPAAIVNPGDPAQRLLDLAAQYSVDDYVVLDHENRYLGMVVGEVVRAAMLQREALPLMVVAELLRTDLPTLRRGQTLETVVELLSRHDVSSLAVVDEDGHVAGMLTRAALLKHYQKMLDEG